ncbi:ECs1072 family phage-associated protein [Erwinia rhapontici]|uniref:ECs1072 family phage-associated protein n=1 Tax=Erwinia rhapontici TaxID=55212 RepID=UPI003BA30E90
MQLNQTDCFRLLLKHVENVASSLDIKYSSIDDVDSYVVYRAFNILKLDLLLIEHKNQYDPDRFFLFGNKALHHYLFKKKNTSYLDAKQLSLHESMMLMIEDINSLTLSPEVIRYLRGQFNFNTPDIKSIENDRRIIQDSEWNPDLAEKHLR